jgi:phosphatidylglycerol---prolipoprotein diacylglyceryl transferase
MRRILFVIPGLGFELRGFGVMLLLACFAALSLTAWRARREKLDPDAVFDLAAWLITGGFIGARVVYLVRHPGAARHFWDVFTFWQGGIVFYGCILGGLVGSLIYWARHPFPFRPMADAVAPSLALGSGLGRLGCWFNGCCHGAPCDLPWAVRFPAGTQPWVRHVDVGLIPLNAPSSLAVHPAQLYAALDGLFLLGLLTWYYPRRRRDGEVMALLMTSYPITRFLIDCLRDDEGPVFAGLTLSQNISVALLACGLIAWSRLARLPRGRYADRVGVAAPAQGPSRAGITAPASR